MSRAVHSGGLVLGTADARLPLDRERVTVCSRQEAPVRRFYSPHRHGNNTLWWTRVGDDPPREFYFVTMVNQLSALTSAHRLSEPT